MYTAFNYLTKKALKTDVATRNELLDEHTWALQHPESDTAKFTETDFRQLNTLTHKLTVYQPGGVFEGEHDNCVALEGPHYPQMHKWYASAMIEDGVVVKVR